MVKKRKFIGMKWTWCFGSIDREVTKTLSENWEGWEGDMVMISCIDLMITNIDNTNIAWSIVLASGSGMKTGDLNSSG